ncbi:hypothetical protein FXO37_23858 [Capsicum annuum]|nr:hypothetical protein FXO37_23858 [Capsicum annuum]
MLVFKITSVKPQSVEFNQSPNSGKLISIQFGHSGSRSRLAAQISVVGVSESESFALNSVLLSKQLYECQTAGNSLFGVLSLLYVEEIFHFSEWGFRYGGISSNGEDWATEGTGNEVFGSERKLQLKEKADKAAEEIKLSQKEISSLTEMLKKVKLQSDEKDKRVETAEAHVAALQKQAADPLLEYDRLSSESSSWFSELRK